jgi:hypothetical protein
MATEANRLELITRLEDARSAKLLSLVTGDRKGHETRIAGDLLPLAYEHLRAIGRVPEIDLFLYTLGGDTLAAWSLANLIREYCDRFAVIVPFRCLSAGTLISLGADEILLAPGSQLGPIDPSVSSPYNPPAPGPTQPGRVSLLPVGVEDVLGFLSLARNEAGLQTEEPMAKALSLLAEKVHPLALGAVYRAKEHVKDFAKSLLSSHIDSETRVDAIAEYLAKLPSHGYLISRQEAQGVFGDDFAIRMPDEFEPTAWSLYKAYEAWFELTNPYNADAILHNGGPETITFPRASLESKNGDQLRSHVFRSTKEINRVQVPQPGSPVPVQGVQERIIAEGWTTWPEGSQQT